MSVNATNPSVQQTKTAHQATAKTPKAPPINIINVAVTDQVAKDPKRIEFMAFMQGQDLSEKTLKDFANHFKNIDGGDIISDDILNKAIKGIDFKGGPNDIPDIDTNSEAFKKIDAEIAKKYKNVVLGNLGSFVAGADKQHIPNPDQVSLVPITIPTAVQSAVEKETSKMNDADLIRLAQDNAPDSAKSVLENNFKAFQADNLDGLQKLDDKELSKINTKLVDDINDIYRLSTIRLLAQLGSAPTPTIKA